MGAEGRALQGQHLVLGDADEDVAVLGIHHDVCHRGLMPLQQPHRLFRQVGAPYVDMGVIATSHWGEKNEHQPLGAYAGTSTWGQVPIPARLGRWVGIATNQPSAPHPC